MITVYEDGTKCFLYQKKAGQEYAFLLCEIWWDGEPQYSRYACVYPPLIHRIKAWDAAIRDVISDIGKWLPCILEKDGKDIYLWACDVPDEATMILGLKNPRKFPIGAFFKQTRNPSQTGEKTQ